VGIFRAAGENRWLSYGLALLARVRTGQERPTEARALLEEAYTVWSHVQTTYGQPFRAYLNSFLGSVALVQGDDNAAAAQFKASLRVLSAVSGSLAMAPNQRRVAAEMARVCGPGGILAVANWTAEGLVGQAARVIASYLPPPPPDAPSPWAWAGEDSVRALLAPFGYALTLACHAAPFSYSSPEAAISYMEEVHGPTIMALRLAGEQGWRAELRAGLLELYSGANTATDGTLAFEQEYLLATAAARR
jgi:SAM-dependent methyltransferase